MWKELNSISTLFYTLLKILQTKSIKGIKRADVFRLRHILPLKVDYKLKSKGRVMVQAVSRRPLSAETWFWSLGSPY
jgi:hypothetical protein